MKPTRTLKLRSERLVELAGGEMSQVVGGSGVSCNPHLCFTVCTSCHSDFQQCYTGDCLFTLNCPQTGDTVC